MNLILLIDLMLNDLDSFVLHQFLLFLMPYEAPHTSVKKIAPAHILPLYRLQMGKQSAR